MSENNGTAPRNAMGLRVILRTLRYRNYRLFFGGQGISLIGTWMQRIAMSWLVYRLTNSVFLLGIVGFFGLVPTFFFAPIAGVFADRWNRRRILVATQCLSMLQASILAVLVLASTVRVWHIIVLSVFLGFVNAFDVPARQSFVPDMIEKREDLGNAIALSSAMFHGARLLGPSIAGIVIAVVGEGMCFLLNAISYVAVIAALLAMRVAHEEAGNKDTNVLQGLKEGFGYAFGFAPIRTLLLLGGLVSLVGMPYTVLAPVFAKDVLHGGPHTLGFLMAASGAGSLAGALYLASRKSLLGLGKLIVLTSSVFGIGLIGFSLSHVLLLSLLFMLLTGFGMMVQMASSNTILQTIADDDKRGRVMSFYTMAFMGMAPFGSLFAGSLASKIGAPNTLLIGGVCCLLGSLLFRSKLPVLQKMARPIYVKRGILPEVALGIQSTSELTRSPEA